MKYPGHMLSRKKKKKPMQNKKHVSLFLCIFQSVPLSYHLGFFLKVIPTSLNYHVQYVKHIEMVSGLK